MALKVDSYFQCQSCGYRTQKWLGRCPDCSLWNTIVEEKFYPALKKRSVPDSIEKPLPVTEISGSNEDRIKTTIKELDRVLGGGIVPGSLVMISGEPGIGKSTLILQVCGKISCTGREVLYISGEESSHQIKMRALRLSVSNKNLLVLPENNLELITAQIEKINPSFVVIDSIQTVYTDEIQSAPGSVSQIRESTSKLVCLSKKINIPVFLVGHVTKDGAIAGPRVLEHMVDTVLYFEGDRGHSFRILRSVKNRFGSTNEIGIFDMKEEGLTEVENPSEIFIADRSVTASGSVIVPLLEGTRPILVEIQALVTRSSNPGLARRMSAGIDHNRVSLLVAVLEKRLGYNFQYDDIFLNVVGGIKAFDTACDLGVTIAIASSYRDKCIDPAIVVIGEVGLSGEIRSVSNLEKRVIEANRLGFKGCIIPKTKKKIGGDIGLTISEVSEVSEAIDIMLG